MKKFTKKDLEKEKGLDKASDKPAKPQIKSGYELSGLFVIALGIAALIALYTYSPSDVHILADNALGYEQQNAVGLVGASIAYVLVYFFGIGSYFWAILFIVLGFVYLFESIKTNIKRLFGAILFELCLISIAPAWKLNIREIYGGGYFGDVVYDYAVLYLSQIGFGLVWALILLYSLHLFFGISWFGLSYTLSSFFARNVSKANEKRKAKKDDILALEDKSSSSSATFTIESNFDDTKEPKKNLKDKIQSLFSRKKENDDEDALDFVLEDVVEIDDDFFDDKDDTPLVEDKPKLSADEEDFFDEIDKKITSDKGKKTKTEWSLFPKKKTTEKPEKVVKKNTKKPVILTLPPFSLLAKVENKEIKQNQSLLQARGERLIKTLSNFKIQAKLERIVTGPVVTMYEVKPADDIRVSRISSLANELAMNLKSVSVRIEAPIRGSDTVGIEVPNQERADVSFRELIEGKEFQSSKSLLTMALGKSINGTSYSADLAGMPHLLIAGATGAGKSVCLNSIIVSLLYKAKPDEVKLLLVDPKQIELTMYEGLPHLVHPIVTDMDLAKNALQWAVEEMGRRYALLKDLKVKNITEYNEKIKGLANPQALPESLQTNVEEKLYHTSLPYLVIIIDELGDLMSTHGKDVETPIVRLAQLARAAGIHLILATQRPSVDVVTGIIKANFPCRISFRVTSKVDSRTILDTMGAETLLGKGDMLFKPGGGQLLRLHGAYLPNEDVEEVVNYWKKLQKADYSLDLTEYDSAKEKNSADSFGRSDIASEAIYQEAIDVLPLMDKVSISALQRRLRIGFNKAALIKEQLVRDGHIQE